MKKILTTLMVVLSFLTASSASTKIGDLYYNLDSSTKTAEVMSLDGFDLGNMNYVSGSLTIPATVQSGSVTYSVTSIGLGAFKWCKGLTSVTIPNTVTSIKFMAFNECTGLTSVAIPNSVTSIGGVAFSGCIGLTSVTIPEGVTEIGEGAFIGSGLTSLEFNAQNCTTCGSSGGSAFPSTISTLTIGNNVTTIPDNFLKGCSQLENLTIPNSVTSIGKAAFYDTGLTSLEFNAQNCTTCGSDYYPAFPSTISTLTIGNNVTSIPAYFLCDGNKLENLTIPNSVTSIGEAAFRHCSALTSVTIPNSVTSIGAYAFSFSSELKSIVIPPHVVSVGSYAFESCGQLVKSAYPSSITNPFPYGSIIISYPSSCIIDEDNIIYNEDKTTIYFAPLTLDSTYEIPNSVTSIGEAAFYRCSGLTSVIIPEGVTDIGADAFYGSGLTSLEFNAKNCTTYGSYGYSAFPSTISTLTIGNNVTSIPSYFLRYGSQIESLTIPNSVTSIGVAAFANCSALTSVTIPNSVTSIGEAAFMHCSTLTSVTIPNSVTSIGVWAFANCSALSSVTIPEGMTYIGLSAFYGSGLTSLEFNAQNCTACGFTTDPAFPPTISTLTIGNNVTSIPAYFLCDGSQIESLSIPNSVTSIGTNAFYNSTKLQSLTLGSGLHIIKSDAFANCSSLNNLNIPSNVYKIDDNVFSGCFSLSNLTFEEGENASVLQLGSNDSNPLFADCPLDEVYIGRKLSYNANSSNGYSPFYRNTSLRSVEITDAETHIYDNEFYGCSNLKTLKIGNGVTAIGKRAFSGCSSLDYFSAGNHVKTIGEEAFSDCTGLTKYYSYSIVPPVCGDQALDDINKWDCTLYVPDESIDEYQAAPQWKDFFFIKEMDVLVTELRLNREEVFLGVEDTVQLTVEILPSNATNKAVEWSSSDDSIATVNESGLVTALSEGTATITVRSMDGNSESSCDIVVMSTIGIDGIEATPFVEVYNLNGYKVSDSTDNLAAGIYIVRRGDKTYKISVK